MLQSNSSYQSITVSGFDRLVPFGPVASLPIIIAGSVVSFILFGFWYPYWRIADMDFMIVYNALVLNDGKPQEFFDHPAYLKRYELNNFLQRHEQSAIRLLMLSH